tara:strand:+ start:313 stop:810 length:498 start_codon:yes stop_codon:yes gene_type:complete
MKEKLYLSAYYDDPDYPHGVVLIEFLHEDFKEGTLLKDLYNELIEMKNIKTKQELALEMHKLPFSQISKDQYWDVMHKWKSTASVCGNYYQRIEDDPDFGERYFTELSEACIEHKVIAKGRDWDDFENKKALGWIEIELSRDKTAFYNDGFWKISDIIKEGEKYF